MSATSIESELISWFASQPRWLNEAYRRLLSKSLSSLPAADLEEIYQIATRELALVTSSQELPSQLREGDFPTTLEFADDALRLVSVGKCTGVNSLAPESELTFGPNLTIVYGANGAGKSGFARVLKDGCRCNTRAQEEILRNVYEAASGTVHQTAELRVARGDTVQPIQWQPKSAKNADLSRFAVFDSKAARSYITTENTVPLVPSELLALEALGRVIGNIKQRLSTESAGCRPDPKSLQAFSDQTEHGKWIAAISAGTAKSELEAKLVWSETDETNLQDRTTRLKSLQANGPAAIRAQIALRRDRAVAVRQAIASVEELLSEEAVRRLRELVEERALLTKQRDALSKLAEGESAIKGVGTETWEQLMRAAAELYSHQGSTSTFPGVSNQARCMLCQQVLPPESRARLTTLWEFLNSEVSQKVDRVRVTLDARLRDLAKISKGIPIRLDLVKDELAAELPEVWPKVPKYLEVATEYRDQIVASVRTGEWDVSFPPADLTPKCDEAIQKLNMDEAALGDAAKAAATEQALRKEVAELTARKRAFEGADVIRKFHESSVRSAAFARAAEQVSTRDLSLKVGSLQKCHIVEAFSASVLENVKQLGLRRIVPKINARTVAGKVTQSVAVDGCKFQNVTPEQVFSEGERTVLALAYFLAESADSTHTSGLIFDDPVTSMDHRYRTTVVRRLTELASDFQVIVFTHDLPFFCELREFAEERKTSTVLRTVYSFGGKAGLSTDGEPYDAMKVTQQETVLHGMIVAAGKSFDEGSVERYSEVVERFYSRLRAAWERAVEEVVFNGVVQRFDKCVKTLKLRQVVVDQETVQRVFEAMTRLSGLTDAHDTANAVNGVLPTVEEMKTDLKSLTDFRLAHGKKKQQADKANAHLA
jgi:energy-coupling factor transporter ATP-binding protein EcfA2